MRNDGKKKSAESLGQAIKGMFSEYHLDNKFNESDLVASWGKIMGKAVEKRTSKVYIQNRKLFVELTSAPLKNELSMSKMKVLKLLEEEMGQAVVDDVVFY
ncbi:MAG: DUF721 domain-containing protein [Cyclobacteriaceae bacterium]|nr:DUF721 domain-containing protein [Cyclobacteriaceae bacterium]